MTSSRFVKVFAILLICLDMYHCQEVGEPCIIEESNQRGTCRIHLDCPGIEELAKENGPITICGFYELTTPIVCCKNVISTHFHPQPVNDLGIDRGDITFPSDNNNNNHNLQGSAIFSGAAGKSEQKCLEYTKNVTDVVHVTPLITNLYEININVTKCEYNSVALIVGGTPALTGEFPFMVSKQFNAVKTLISNCRCKPTRELNCAQAAIGFPDSDDRPEWRCGGTLISDQWILTAAHCTFSRDSKPKWVRLGALDLGKNKEYGRVDYLIDRVVVHPEYKYPIKYNDIALLSTDRIVQFSKVVRPACLYTKSSFPHKVALATGWGQTDYSGPNSEKLLKVLLNIYDNSYCARAYQNEGNIGRGIIDSMLCAGELKGGRDTCLGDSGGPLFITEKENMCKFHVIGVTSFGKLCAQENVPAIYTRVSEYVKWIENTIWQ